jgi:hypothetical protein
MMRKKIFTAFLAIALLAPLAHAVIIGFFPGLEQLVRQSDAVVILRVDKKVTDMGDNLYSTHDCYIYQTLKGDIPPNSTARFQLMDTRSSFATPYATHSTHLMFLTKKRSENEPADYRTIEIIGANVALSPLGHEVLPEGNTTEDQIRSILAQQVKRSITAFQKEQDFLNMMIHNEAEQGGPAYPPQGVGSADP